MDIKNIFDIKNSFIKKEIEENEDTEKNVKRKSRTWDIKIKLIVMALVGIMFLMQGNKKEEKIKKDTPIVKEAYAKTEGNNTNNNVKKLEEERIKKFLKTYDEVEDAEVLLSIKNGRRKVLAYENDRKVNTSNDTKNEEIHEKVVTDSENSPYVVCENETAYQGIVILVKGNVRQDTIIEIREAMRAYLNIGINRVKVYSV